MYPSKIVVMEVVRVHKKIDKDKLSATVQITSGESTRLDGLFFTCSETNAKWKVVSIATFIPSKALLKGILILILEKVGQGSDIETGHHLVLSPENKD